VLIYLSRALHTTLPSALRYSSSSHSQIARNAPPPRSARLPIGHEGRELTTMVVPEVERLECRGRRRCVSPSHCYFGEIWDFG
jgi:hypothetical protein